jgi:type IV pilus assembly protein PilC
MPKFAYRAYTPDGPLEEKVITAAALADVRGHLVGRGYRVVSIKEDTKQGSLLYRLFPSFFKVRNTEVYLFCRQMAAFVRAGVPITDGIRLIGEEASPGFSVALGAIVEDLDRGLSLSAALQKHPKVFNRLFIDMIHAAEMSGNLDGVLLQVAAYMQRAESALKKLRNAMIYPAIVMVLAIVVSTILVVFVLPQFVILFDAFHADLPLPTKMLIAVGKFGKEYPLFIVGGVLAVGLFVFAALKTPAGRTARDRLILKTPVIGPIVLYAVVERFCRTLATMLSAGIPIGQTFDVAIASTGNIRFQKGLQAVRERMISGDGFSAPLASTELFPRMMLRMIRVGEETGTLDHQLQQVAEYYAEENDFKIGNMIKMIEPAMVIAVALVVGFIGVAVISPMYGILSQVKG